MFIHKFVYNQIQGVCSGARVLSQCELRKKKKAIRDFHFQEDRLGVSFPTPPLVQ